MYMMLGTPQAIIVLQQSTDVVVLAYLNLWSTPPVSWRSLLSLVSPQKSYLNHLFYRYAWT